MDAVVAVVVICNTSTRHLVVETPQREEWINGLPGISINRGYAQKPTGLS